MIKNYLLWIFLLFVAPVAANADKQAAAVAVVACVNSANGYPLEIDGQPWELPQAVLELPYKHDTVFLAPDYYIVVGRRLGWHGTWAAFLHLGVDGWLAFETRAEDDRLAMFAASFVPDVVVAAFAGCGVKWGGYWTEEYPLIELAPEQQPVAPIQQRPIWNGEGLLPPQPND